MCQHNLPCSIVLPTACFPEGPSPHFTLCSFWRRRPRLEAVQEPTQNSKLKANYYMLFVYCRELSTGIISLTGDRAQGDDSKQDLYNIASVISKCLQIIYLFVCLMF